MTEGVNARQGGTRRLARPLGRDDHLWSLRSSSGHSWPESCPHYLVKPDQPPAIPNLTAC